MKLILITENGHRPNEAAIINELFSNGLECLHVRKYGYTVPELCTYIDLIAPQYREKLVICDHFNILTKYNLQGVHLNSHIRNDEKIGKEINKFQPKSISTSFHVWQEFTDVYFPYSYAFISPVFDSISKQGYKAAIDLNGANTLKKSHSDSDRALPEIIGLGGVDDSNIALLHNHQFDGAAVLGAVWQNPDPVSALLYIQKEISALKAR